MTPLVRESTQTWLTLGEKSCKLNVELLKAAVAATQPGSFAEAAARTGEIWEGDGRGGPARPSKRSPTRTPRPSNYGSTPRARA